jgi:hypothetical protein
MVTKPEMGRMTRENPKGEIHHNPHMNAKAPSPVRGAPWLLLAGDMVALFLFVLVGQREHELLDNVHPLLNAAASALPFWLIWIIAGWPLRAFSLPGRPSSLGQLLRHILGRGLIAWLVAAPLAVVLRALILRRSTIPTLFLIVAMAFGGLFILGWRFVFGLLAWGRYRSMLKEEPSSSSQ